MPLRALVLDFDGTFTDVEREAEPFLAAFRADVEDLVARPGTRELWAELESEVLARPTDFGWELGGRIVAPGNADPYVRATCVAGRLFDRLGMLRDPETRAAISQALYRKAYERSATVFRDDAAATLGRVLDSGLPAFVVTNARTDTVEQKLRTLLGDRAPALGVIGDARKFAVAEPAVKSDRFDRVPAEKHFEGLSTRPVLLRRGPYFEALSRVWESAKAEPEETLVVGDIFELDLALPAELGSRVHLLCRAGTAAYEKAAVDALGERGSRSERLSAILEHLPSSRRDPLS